MIDLVITAWRELDTCRQIGMDVGPIPWTATRDWCEFHELGRSATIQIQAAVRFLDIERAQREASKRALAGAGGR